VTSLHEQHTALFVELDLDGERRYFEFGVNEETAVSVGSSPHAHLRLNRPGVPPVAFHLERAEGAIWVVPGYGTEVRLNTALVRSRARLSKRCVLEFPGVSLSTRVLSVRPDSAAVPLRATLEHLREGQLEPPLDCATVQFALPGSPPPQPDIPTRSVALDRGSPLVQDFGQDAEQVQLFITRVLAPPSTREALGPVPPRLEPVPARPEPVHSLPGSAPDALHQTLVIERPKALDRPPATERPPVAEAPAAEPHASLFETQIIGTREGLTSAPGLSSPLEPAAPPPPPPAAVAPPPLAPFHAAPPQPAPLRSQQEPVAPAALSLDAQTTVFETVHAPINAPRPPSPEPAEARIQPSRAGSRGELPPSGSSRTSVGWLARLGLLTKSKPVPVLAGALGVALLIGVGAANTAPPFTGPPAEKSGTAPGSKSSAGEKSGPGSASTTGSPSSLPPSAAAPSTSAAASSSSASPPRSLVLKAAGTAAPPRKRARNTPNDPELARAVGDVSAGRYREAAEAYAALASKAQDAEPYRTIASLLEKASSADCKPSSDTKPFCPEVLK
jgi:hypothetical protein